MLGRGFLFLMLILVAALGVAFLGLSYEATHSRTAASERAFHVGRGENAVDIGGKLESDGLVRSKWFFVYYIWKEGLRGRTQAGDYVLSGGMTVPEIAFKLTSGETESLSVDVTFPEGWDSRRMAERLTAKGLPGDGFLALVERPLPEWRAEYPFLADLPESASLEGYLFPDTYSFFKNATAEDIVTKMLADFGSRFPADQVERARAERGSLFEVLTMASIVENEVTSTEDRKQVADLFWRRLGVGQALQSDATVKYVLGENKVQHSYEETRTDSPYNTYVNTGLPPGPIGNPGLDAIYAALYPTPNNYWYFLSDPGTGETVFATTFDQHVANKSKHGL